VHLVYVALDNVERNLTRVQGRVAAGGHSVPDDDIRRRYARSLRNAYEAVRIADIAKVYDNSGDGHRLVLVFKAGVVTWRSDHLPAWAGPLASST
jgi:predicted ABC-type ATPase